MDSTEAPALPNFLLPCSGLTRASMDRPSRRRAMDPRVKPGGDSRSLALSHPRCGGRGIKLSLDRRVHAEPHLVHLLGSGRRISEEHKSELQSLMSNTYAGFCLKQ